MTIREAVAGHARKLKNAGIESYILDAQLLLAHVLKSPKTYILINPECPLKDDEITKYARLIALRQTRYPIQYILGSCEFMGLEFDVTPDVLIPRPDTEILVESVIKKSPQKILEIGTGSGCISISIAKHLPNSEIDAIDISPPALKIAERNAKKNNVQNRIKFIHSDIMTKNPTEKYDIIVSNPPYIESFEISKLQPEVCEHEPIIALDGGPDGLNFYRRIAQIAPHMLNKNGIIALELGHTQLQAVQEIFSLKSQTYQDLSGINRVVHFQLP